MRQTTKGVCVTITEKDFELEHDKLIVDLMRGERNKDDIITLMHYLSILKKRLFYQ